MEAEATLGEVISEGPMAAGYPLQVASSGLLLQAWECADLQEETIPGQEVDCRRAVKRPSVTRNLQVEQV
jgi:hypothetical protein